mgnify:CR=1 FL=1
MPTHSVRSASLAHLLSPVSIIPLLAAGMSAPAKAQTTLELPGIVVEGATLEAPRSAPKRKSAATTSPASNGVSQQEGPAEVAEEGAAKSEAASNQAGGIPAAHLGTAVTVVTGEDLQRQQIRHAADALRSLPGVSVNRAAGSPAGLTQVRIRGAEANHTLVLIDGIEANTGSDGAFDFSDLMTEDIERVEVIRGPQSALYGSNAIGGVINILTKKGGGPLSVTARAEGGSFGTKSGAARVSGGNERIWGAATVQHQRSDGFNIAPEGPLGEKDGYRITSLSANAGAMLTENIRLDLNIRHSDKHVQNDSSTGDLRDGWDIVSDTLDYTNSSALLMGANLRWDMLDGDLTHLFKASRNLTRMNNFFFGSSLGPPSVTEINDDAYRLSYQTSYRFETPALGMQHSVTGLVEHGRESFENKSAFGFVDASRKLTSFAGEWRGNVFERVYLSAGIRHDNYDTFKDFTSWRTGISIPFPEIGLRPHASAGTGMKAPTLVEQFGIGFYRFLPNPALLPETSKSWDAGVEFTFLRDKAIVDVTYFEMDITNKITDESVECLEADQCMRPINLDGVSKRKGIEVDARFRILPNLSLGLAYTYLDAFDSSGEREIRRPRHAARGDITYKFDEGRGTFHVAAIYNGKMQDNVFNFYDWTESGRVTLDDYWLVTAAASYKLNPGLEIYGRIENLFDEDYEEIFGFSTAGIAGYAGLRWTFDAEQLGNGLSMK